MGPIELPHYELWRDFFKNGIGRRKNKNGK
jgi:hypothetical protein